MLPREVSTSDVNDAIVKLKDAVTSGDLKKVSEIINFIDMGNPERQRDVHFLLRDAIDKKFIEIANLLLEKGAKVNVSDVTQSRYYNIDSPLNLACKIGNEDLVKNILDKGADINFMERSGYTPLSTAADKGHKNIVKMLLERGALVNTEYKKFEIQPLFSACKQGDMETVKLLLSRGADINEVSTNDFDELSTPLCIATDKNHVEIAKLLVENGAEVNRREGCAGYSPLHFACENGNEELVSLYLSKGADVSDEPDDEYSNKYCRGFMPIHRAAINGHAKIVELLLDSGASINAVSNDVCIGGGVTPLHFACSNGNEELIELLIKKGADIDNNDNEYDETPLQMAVSNKQINLIKLLIENGANLNAIDHKGNTVLHLTCKAKRLQILELLLKNNLDINTRNFNGCLPIHVAVSTGFKKGVELLLKLGADVNARDKFERTPLHHVTRHVNVILNKKVDIVEIVDLLVKEGADVNAKNGEEETPLHLACRFGFGTESYVPKLVTSAANINEKNENGMTPLQVAVTNGRILPSINAIEYLICNGADIEIKENTNKTALHLAYMLERSDIFELLLNYGADINNMFDPDYVQDEAHSEDEVGLLNPLNFNLAFVDKATKGIKGISEMLRKHIIKLKCANLHVNERIFGERSNKAVNMPYWTGCEKEVIKMKNTKLDNVSLYYILSKHYYDSAKYLRNENILKDINFNGLRKKYPIYGGMLSGKIRLAIIRMICRVTSIEYLNKVFKYKMPLLCINIIIEYLTNRDLLNFVRVVSPPTSEVIDTLITLGTHMGLTCDEMCTSAEADDIHTDDSEEMNVTDDDESSDHGQCVVS